MGARQLSHEHKAAGTRAAKLAHLQLPVGVLVHPRITQYWGCTCTQPTLMVQASAGCCSSFLQGHCLPHCSGADLPGPLGTMPIS